MDSSNQPPTETSGRVVRPGMHVESPADRFVEAMEGAAGEDLLILASRAVRHDHGCIEARLVLAGHSRDRETRYRHLNVAVEAGEQLWTPVAARLGQDMSWWGFSGTRPYMRAVAALGYAYLEDDDIGAARACFDRLLAMNPHDNQGNRFVVEEMGCQILGTGTLTGVVPVYELVCLSGFWGAPASGESSDTGQTTTDGIRRTSSFLRNGDEPHTA